MKSYMKPVRATMRLDFHIQRCTSRFRETAPGKWAELQTVDQLYRYLRARDRLFDRCVTQDKENNL